MAAKGVLGKDVEVVAVVDIVTDAKYFAYQLKYDSVHGRFSGTLATEKSPGAAEDDVLVVNGSKIKCIMATKEPSQLPWKDLGVEFVIESTGLFTDSEKAKGHLAAGAKKVINKIEVSEAARREASANLATGRRRAQVSTALRRGTQPGQPSAGSATGL